MVVYHYLGSSDRLLDYFYVPFSCLSTDDFSPRPPPLVWSGFFIPRPLDGAHRDYCPADAIGPGTGKPGAALFAFGAGAIRGATAAWPAQGAQGSDAVRREPQRGCRSAVQGYPAGWEGVGEAPAAPAAARSPPRLRASLDRVVLVRRADRLVGPCGAVPRVMHGARKSCVLVRDDANSCASSRVIVSAVASVF
ncbi:hypothetical protein F01_50162 [Burkholderia cenocepacia]|nr:hypothetical protein F01_50162 [Burkholderia cenocepacia]